MDSQRSLTRLDALFILVLLALSALYTARTFAHSMHPKEDAAILMRYSEHVAEGHGVVWNVGEEPVDGATDFLFMILLAGLVKLGVTIEAAAQGTGFAAHVLTILVIYLAVRTLHGVSRWLALLPALYLALGPGLGYISMYFGTPFFALFCATTWWLANRLVWRPDSYAPSLAFTLSALVMGLVRPEGVIFAALMLLAVVWAKGWRDSRKAVISFVVVFAVLGGLYFFWRWRYFGYPLPNPFYKKGGGHLHLSSLRYAIWHTIHLSAPFLVPFVVALRSPKTTARAVFALMPCVGFVAMWALLSNEMNILMRFQYPLVPVILISSPGFLVGLLEDWNLPRARSLGGRNRAVAIALLAVTFLGILYFQHRKYGHLPRYRDGRYDVALMLHEYRDRGYTLATTEAGLLPLYSDWRVIDVWGLNDPWIAHHGGITESYLERQNPELIVFHEWFSPISPPAGGGPWFSTVMTLKDYAERKGYILAASYGDTPRDTHYYYVRPDFPESAEIVSRIRETDYFWHASGRRAINFAMLEWRVDSGAGSARAVEQ